MAGRRWLLLVVAVLPIASAGVGLSHGTSTGSLEPVEVEVPFGALAAGSSAGTNGTNASVSIDSGTLTSTDDLLYLNNTNASAAYWVHLRLVGTSGLGALDLLTLGIDNGTATDQIVVQLGSIVADEGSAVRLEPGSTNRIYATHAVALFGSGGATFQVVAADDPQESAVVVTRARLDLI